MLWSRIMANTTTLFTGKKITIVKRYVVLCATIVLAGVNSSIHNIIHRGTTKNVSKWTYISDVLGYWLNLSALNANLARLIAQGLNQVYCDIIHLNVLSIDIDKKYDLTGSYSLPSSYLQGRKLCCRKHLSARLSRQRDAADNRTQAYETIRSKKLPNTLNEWVGRSYRARFC